MKPTDLPIVTKSRLTTDLQGLGIVEGDAVMFHASVKAIGWIVGGPDVVIQSLLDVVGSPGTIAMYVSCEEPVYELEDFPEEWKNAYFDECPPFDATRCRANRKWSILTEYLRTWPGACRSNNPDAGVAALGAKAPWITSDHPLQYGYGPGSPYDKLCQLGGKVLLLGAPLNSLTILHHAEHLARIPNKRIVRYKWPLLQGGKRVWVDIEEFDTGAGIVDWSEGDYFERIALDFMSEGNGSSGKVGAAESLLFDAKELADFGATWIEEKFG